MEESGWRFFDALEGKANISLEVNTKLTGQRTGTPPAPCVGLNIYRYCGGKIISKEDE
ncbi:MAG: hypothetical protein ABH952_06315 [Candidatus Omnitrophota bacterium]